MEGRKYLGYWDVTVNHWSDSWGTTLPGYYKYWGYIDPLTQEIFPWWTGTLHIGSKICPSFAASTCAHLHSTYMVEWRIYKFYKYLCQTSIQPEQSLHLTFTSSPNLYPLQQPSIVSATPLNPTLSWWMPHLPLWQAYIQFWFGEDLMMILECKAVAVVLRSGSRWIGDWQWGWHWYLKCCWWWPSLLWWGLVPSGKLGFVY